MDKLTAPELMFLEENLRAGQAIAKFAQHCGDQCQDPEAKALCSKIVTDHPRINQTLAGFLNPNQTVQQRGEFHACELDGQ